MKYDFELPVLRHPTQSSQFIFPEPVFSELNKKEMKEAREFAISIHVENREKNIKDLSGDRIDLDDEALGFQSEKAIAKILKLKWMSPFDKDLPDVGPYEVRSTKRITGHLIVRARDSFLSPYILVCCREAPVFQIQGFIHPRDILKRKRNGEYAYGREDEDNPSLTKWWVPYENLLDFRILQGLKYD